MNFVKNCSGIQLFL